MEIAVKLKSGEYTLKSRNGKSEIWKKLHMVCDVHYALCNNNVI